MRVHKYPRFTKYVLEPGEYHVTDEPVVMSTLLGSCVSVCLYEPIARVMAMNHFLLSVQKYVKPEAIISSGSGRYGIHAMELIINGMLKLGAKRNRLQAKAFGGGNVLSAPASSDNMFNIGHVNVEFVREFLEKEKIPMVSSDLGGNHGRIIVFYGNDYSVFVRKIAQSETLKVAIRDKQYWKSMVEKKRQGQTNIEVWN